ncbi:MAG: hypothetical protein LBH38_01850 [Holosporales bacterium]|nr:hypothetical protein [Holosporales bacterium]
MKKMPVFFHPARVLLVGFDTKFPHLFQNDTCIQHPIILEFCQNVVEAFSIIDHAYDKNDVFLSKTTSEENFLRDACYGKISSPERFHRFSTVVINSKSSISIHEALLLFEHIKDWRIKKVLIADPSESSLALDVLDTHLVDALLFHEIPQLVIRITNEIHLLQWQYFLTCSNGLPSALFYPEENTPFLAKSALYEEIDIFLRANPDIVEFYQVDRYGTHFLLTRNGKPVVLFFTSVSSEHPWPPMLRERKQISQYTRQYRLANQDEDLFIGNVAEGRACFVSPCDKIISFLEACKKDKILSSMKEISSHLLLEEEIFLPCT